MNRCRERSDPVGIGGQDPSNSAPPMPSVLPQVVHVFVRDWLSANNILLRSPDEPVLIDSGYVRHAPLTLALLASPHGLGDQPLARLVNTHCHSDHMGGNAAIKTRYRCPIALPEGEVPLISRLGRKDAAARLLRSARGSLQHRRSHQAWRDTRLGRSRMARARGTGARHGRARVLQPRASGAHLR